MKNPYRIITKEGKIKYVGTGENSWFSIEEARLKVNRSNGEKIVMSDGVNIFPGEVL